MSGPNILTDSAGYFFEDHSRVTCDFCGAAHDFDESRTTDDGRSMCFACFQILWKAEHAALAALQRETGVLFVVMRIDLDELLEEHGHLLEGRMSLKEDDDEHI